MSRTLVYRPPTERYYLYRDIIVCLTGGNDDVAADAFFRMDHYLDSVDVGYETDRDRMDYDDDDDEDVHDDTLEINDYEQLNNYYTGLVENDEWFLFYYY